MSKYRVTVIFKDEIILTPEQISQLEIAVADSLLQFTHTEFIVGTTEVVKPTCTCRQFQNLDCCMHTEEHYD
jgi:hypothetical protein